MDSINLKDLFFVIIKRTGFILLFGFLVAGVAFGFVYMSYKKDANVLDLSKRLDAESDAQYSERALYVNRAEDIINSIDTLNNQIEYQRQYVTDSILMQINSENEAVTTVTLVIEMEDNSVVGMDEALLTSYSTEIAMGDYLNQLAEELGTNQGYLTELINVEYNTDYSQVVLDTSGNYGIAKAITITVIGPTTDYTDTIMNSILDNVVLVNDYLNESLALHTVSLTKTQSYYKTDSTTRDLQYIAVNRFETLQKQISLYEESLDEIASNLGVGNKDILYAYFSYNDESWNASNSTGSVAFKSAVFAFAGGIVFALLVIVAHYLLSKKFPTQANFFTRFPTVRLIGVMKPQGRRSSFARYIDTVVGDDNRLSEENNQKLIAANLRNMTLGMNRVLITGTADSARLKELVVKLGVNADVKESFFVDTSCLESLPEYDGVVLVEQRKYSDCKLISEELKLINNADAKLVGAIII